MAKSAKKEQWEFETRVAQVCARPPLKPFKRASEERAEAERAPTRQSRTMLLRLPAGFPARLPARAPVGRVVQDPAEGLALDAHALGAHENKRPSAPDRRPMWLLIGLMLAVLGWRLLPIAAARLSVVAATVSTPAEP
jgi:hypothetical protein